MKGTNKKLLITAAILAIAGGIVFGGYAVRSAKAAFSVPLFSNQQINSAGVPELGVVELKGTIDAIAADSYTVSGLTFRFDTLTIISGAPIVGDPVQVKALLLPDLTRYALMIEKTAAIVTPPEFSFFGLVETMAVDMWTVSGEQVQVSLTTVIDPGIAAGALVEIKGTVVGGLMTADSIGLKESMPGSVGTEVELFGTVESITGSVYVIGGKTVNTDALTQFVGTVAVGSFVRVHATLNTDGTYLASELELVTASVIPTPGAGDDDEDEQGEDQDDQGEDEDAQEIKVTGVLESIAAGLWVVDGVSFVVDDTTEIEGDPQVGDMVKIEATVQSDGTNLAHEIELEEDESVGDDDASSGSDDDDDSGNSGSDDDESGDDDDSGGGSGIGDDDHGGGSGGGGDDDDEDED